MTASRDEHDHSLMEIPEGYQDPDGRAVDLPLLGRLVGAAYDGCPDCQRPLIDRLVDDGDTTARLVELACLMVAESFGGVPRVLTDPAVDGMASLEFRQLAAAGVDGQNAAMWAQCRQMVPEQRRAAAGTALGLLAGGLGQLNSPEERIQVQVPMARVHNQEMEDPGPGEHLWTTMALFRVPAEQVDALRAGRDPGPMLLDHENVLTLEMGCYKCEEPFSRRLAFRRCKGSLDLQP